MPNQSIAGTQNVERVVFSAEEVVAWVVDDMLFRMGIPIENVTPNAIYVLSLYNKQIRKALRELHTGSVQALSDLALAERIE